jgi:MSHA pilin protein MshD
MPIKPISIHHQRTGFTLIELIITIIIMSFAAIIITPYLTAVTHGPDPVLREKAIALGQAMMDEILAKRWDNDTASGGGPIVTDETIAPNRGTDGSRNATAPLLLGPETGVPDNENPTAADRTTWDDVDDYNGVNEPIGVNFFDQNGNPVPGTWTGFTRSVTVDYIIISSPGTPSIDTTNPPAGIRTDSKRIVVTVTSPLGETFNLVAITCNL